MPPGTERMRKLQDMLAKEPDDLFLLYALAMEFKTAGDLPDAVLQLECVLAKDAGHIAAWQQLAQVHELAGDVAAAKQAYTDGVRVANEKGDAHAASEMAAALAVL